MWRNGSSFGNPGPSGSGFVVYDQNNEVICCRSHALGTSTNAYAEVDGLMEAAEYAELDLPSRLWNLPVCLFVDNRNAISLAAGWSNSFWCAEEVESTRNAIKSTARRCPVWLFWVPGHAKIEGNEVADTAAEHGSCGVTKFWEECPPLVQRADMPTPDPPEAEAEDGGQNTNTKLFNIRTICAIKRAGAKRKHKRRATILNRLRLSAPANVSYNYNTRSRRGRRHYALSAAAEALDHNAPT